MPLIFDSAHPFPKAAQYRIHQRYDGLRIPDKARVVPIHLRAVKASAWGAITGGGQFADATWYDQSGYIFAKLDGNGRIQNEEWIEHELFHAISDGLFDGVTWGDWSAFCARNRAILPSRYARDWMVREPRPRDPGQVAGRGPREAIAECGQAVLGTVRHAGLEVPKLLIRQKVAQVMARFV